MTRICFIGGGCMTRSLVGGLISQGYAPHRIHISDPNKEKRDRLQQDFNVQVYEPQQAAAYKTETIVLSVKPHAIKSAIESTVIHITHQPLWISVAAGISLHHLSIWLGHTPSIIRCMPNTPSFIQQGCSVLCANANTRKAQQQQAESLLQSVGQVHWLANEADMDAVTALSGSGPAYFFLFMEALIDAGEQLGLTKQFATQLVQQTAVGATLMAKNSSFTVDQLRKQVTSPGGTTEKALSIFEASELRQTIKHALHAAAQQSKILSENTLKNE